MKKINKEYLNEKDFLRLQRASIANWKTQRNLGWIELDEPVHSGFAATLTLRSDVANREDVWVFQEIVDKFSTSAWAKKLKNSFSLIIIKEEIAVFTKINSILSESMLDLKLILLVSIALVY